MKINILNQLINSKDQELTAYKPYGHLTSPKKNNKLTKVNQLLFLRIYKEVRKGLKVGNQFDVALEIIKIFQKAKLNNVFSYVEEYKSVQIYDSELEQDVLKTIINPDFISHINNSKLFYKEIGISQKSINYFYKDSRIYHLAEYIEDSSPKAIVQMRKRLLSKKINNFNNLNKK
jgi:hypothetical protein